MANVGRLRADLLVAPIVSAEDARRISAVIKRKWREAEAAARLAPEVVRVGDITIEVMV